MSDASASNAVGAAHSSMALDGDDEVLSGEAVAIEVQPVGLFFRALGALIDAALSWAVFFGYIAVRYWMLGAFGDPALDRILAVLALVTAFVIVPCTIETLTHGRSLGRLAVGGRIVRVDGGAAGFRHALIRALIGVFETYLTFGAVAFLTAAFTARSQRLGDLVAGTYSQKVRTPRLAARVPVMPPGLESWAAIADVARMPDRLARRISQFLDSAPQLMPAARARIAHELLAEATPFISPVPAAAPEAVLVAATVLRRERERRALALADARVQRLSGVDVGA
ncbi:RDD family protein [Microbacterium sp. Au-Mic1]|uniref:RDD family protein n=1 Tax=Microbacterium sp. Au-Mic1 TaxID=2906457 RepID=UPI001E540FD7|nr:RDD family protein [Microbacterium sp. Au-Mic1]MCE4025719.1 RDD family protein [Microbacterium sp. Au-Mic1]